MNRRTSLAQQLHHRGDVRHCATGDAFAHQIGDTALLAVKEDDSMRGLRNYGEIWPSEVMEYMTRLTTNVYHDCVTRGIEQRVSYLDSSLAQIVHGLHDARARTDQVFNHETLIATGKTALDHFSQPVLLLFPATHHHRPHVVKRHSGGDRQRSVRDATQHIVADVRGYLLHESRNECERFWVGDDGAEIDIDRRLNARSQCEGSEFDCTDVMEVDQ